MRHNRTEFWVSSDAFVLLYNFFSVRASLLKFSGDVGGDMELLRTKGQVSSSPHSEVRPELAEKCVELSRLTLMSEGRSLIPNITLSLTTKVLSEHHR